jgi:hypothetical protein
MASLSCSNIFCTSYFVNSMEGINSWLNFQYVHDHNITQSLMILPVSSFIKFWVGSPPSNHLCFYLWVNLILFLTSTSFLRIKFFRIKLCIPHLCTDKSSYLCSHQTVISITVLVKDQTSVIFECHLLSIRQMYLLSCVCIREGHKNQLLHHDI